MKQIYLILALLTILISCKSIDLPSVEQSDIVINQSKPKLEELDKAINSKFSPAPEANDFRIAIKSSAINSIIDNFAYNRNDDINFYFLATKPLMTENKTILGVNFTNYLNIDTGFITVNLKKFRFNKFENNKIYGIIEIEGEGNISVSGKYTGIPASVSPDVYLYLYEDIVFDVKTTDSGYVVLMPQPKDMKLKTKISIKLLEWKIPYYQEIPLKLTDIVKPMTIPIAVKPDIQFPLPAESFGKEKVKMANYKLELKNTKLYLNNNIIDYRSDMDFIRK
jgi:hypothetical protein